MLSVGDKGGGLLETFPRHRAGRGPRVLVAEQETRVAAAIKDTLEQAGYGVDGPVTSIPEALAHLEAEAPDAAILDLDLCGQWSVPLARALKARGVPFFLVTSHPCPGFLDAAYDGAHRLTPPFRRGELSGLLERVLLHGTIAAGARPL